ncbi:MAG: hypothetical protein N3E49_00755 [Bacteroidia bacterium]|nr:hypothetical protein [Bacteroidia bacterium]
MIDTTGGPSDLNPAIFLPQQARTIYSPQYIRPRGWYLIDRTGDYPNHRGSY